MALIDSSRRSRPGGRKFSLQQTYVIPQQRFRRYVVAAGVAALMTLAAHHSIAAVFEVDQDNVNFTPQSLTIKKGDSVRFKNSATMNHNISIIDSDGDADDLGIEKPGEVVERVFKKSGKYKVRCSIHPRMKMTITVK